MKQFLHRFSYMTLSTKLKLLMLFILAPLAAMICLSLAALARYSGQYDAIIQNLTVASDFSIDFQKSLDYKVYRFIVSGKNFEEFNPFIEIEQARGVLNRLSETTVQEDSKAQLRYIRKFLDNLEKSVIEIRDKDESYDWNMDKLESNIRTNTDLASESVYRYIYHETQMLAQMRQETRKAVQNAVISISAVSGVLILLLCGFALGMANGIARPLRELCRNIRIVGEGDFTVRSVESHTDEVQNLSESFDLMVGRIGTLMENVRQEQQNLRHTELRLLQAQINPHFLYNTFDTIIWLAEDHQDEQVVEMVTSLSTFFRTTLSKGRDVITVREETLHIKSYLEIQKFRYRDIMEYEIEIPEELGDYNIPKLTLQPLVENALYHGIKNKRGLGTIKVTAALQNERMRFCVADNGIGMDKEKLEHLRASLQNDGKVGFGLANVHARIGLYYGAEFGLEIQSDYGKGTSVAVTMPAKIIEPME